MKFGTFLLEEAVPEWASKYIQYGQLRDKIKRISEEAVHQLLSNPDSPDLVIEDLPSEKAFFEQLNSNIAVVDQFYKDLLAYFLADFKALLGNASHMGLLEEYKPLDQTFRTRIRRQIARTGTGKRVRVERSDSDLDSGTELDRARGDICDELREMTAQELLLCHQKVFTVKALRDAFCEFYRGLTMLQSYVELNVTAVQKILKKHDKNIGTSHKEIFVRERLLACGFPRHVQLSALISECEHQFSVSLFGGHRTRAMRVLRVPSQEHSPKAAFFRLGMGIGLVLPFAAMLVYLHAVQPNQDAFPRWNAVITIYRMLGMSILVLWAWGINTLIWTHYKVNYIFIFQLDPRRIVAYQDVFTAASAFTLWWTLSALLYTMGAIRPPGFGWLGDIPWEVHPLLHMLVSLSVLAYFQFVTSFWLVRALGRLVTAPFWYIRFEDTFLGDQLLSATIILLDMAYTVCFFTRDCWTHTDYCAASSNIMKPIIVLLAPTWRTLQALRRCHEISNWAILPHVASKYTVTVLVAVFSALNAVYKKDHFLALWVVSIFVSTCYTFYWDLVKDWSLLDKKHGYLRAKLLYPKWAYYFAISTNLVMRLMWTLTISPGSINLVLDPRIFSFILAAVEIARRTQWNLFKVENEQINNTDHFRALDIEVPGLDLTKLHSRVPHAESVEGADALRKDNRLTSNILDSRSKPMSFMSRLRMRFRPRPAISPSPSMPLNLEDERPSLAKIIEQRLHIRENLHKLAALFGHHQHARQLSEISLKLVPLTRPLAQSTATLCEDALTERPTSGRASVYDQELSSERSSMELQQFKRFRKDHVHQS
eukprot:TRINITY_DN3835_c0_g2_i2.p1 TRINITY_DN3835_c0_g2~~TRINITY_DN3835_c0_g2_i2.p1  ORF type:complete len:838 (+),score=146.43 TRINITY_DN3835_c0_g2_i2:48-2516(+)